MRLNCLSFCVLASAVLTGCVSPQRKQGERLSPSLARSANEYTIHCMDDLVRMNRCDLENLYRHAEVGCPPKGVTDGRAIMNPGTAFTVPASQVTRLIWQGKVFTDDNMMVNRFFGVRAIHARVYAGESWLDGQPSLILDYADTSKLYSKVRDEVREISPGLYLGIAFKRTDTGPELDKFFTLDSRTR